MMAQDDRVVVGLDVAKDKVDACIRPLSLRRTEPSTAEGRRKLVAWLRKHKVGKAVMEASGGYEGGGGTALRKAGIEGGVVDPKRGRHFAPSAGGRAKKDVIEAGMIARVGETLREGAAQAPD